METVISHFHKIQCPKLRELAIANHNGYKHKKETSTESLVAAIGNGFRWAHTKQDFAFWNAVHSDAPNIKTYESYAHLDGKKEVQRGKTFYGQNANIE